MHMQNHTGEKLSLCDTDFSVNICLERHMETNLGAKPIPSIHCDKTFAWIKKTIWNTAFTY